MGFVYYESLILARHSVSLAVIVVVVSFSIVS